ncbi:MAG: cation diffusion facilitator family transporter [Mycobacteriales bacterium]
MGGEDSTGTVLTALGANLAIAVAKITAGVISGSSAMLAEGAHSVADTTNQVFLLTSLKLSRQPADETHPFGYGKERFFWSLLAAVGIFVSGAVFSLFEGVHSLLSPAEEGAGYLLAYGVLGVSFVAEGISWLRAYAQLRKEATGRNREVLEHVRLSSDPTVKTVFFEDSAALAGLVLAAAGLGLHQLTGRAFWDAGAAIAIGVLLAVVAYVLGRDTKELLIGEAAPEPARRALRDALLAEPDVDAVLELRTMLVGPATLLVAARVDMNDRLDARGVEDSTDGIEQRLKERFPDVNAVYLDPSSTRGGAGQVAETSPDASSPSSSNPSATR